MLQTQKKRITAGNPQMLIQNQYSSLSEQICGDRKIPYYMDYKEGLPNNVFCVYGITELFSKIFK